MAVQSHRELRTPSDLSQDARKNISASLNTLLSDVFALYMKTKNFHWHVSGPHFRDFHLMLDDHATEIFAMTDDVGERVRKIGGQTLHSIGEIAKRQRIKDNDAEYVTPQDMLSELAEDNRHLASSMRGIHDMCDEFRDFSTASLLENWIDEAEERNWFLFESTRRLGAEG